MYITCRSLPYLIITSIASIIINSVQADDSDLSEFFNEYTSCDIRSLDLSQFVVSSSPITFDTFRLANYLIEANSANAIHSSELLESLISKLHQEEENLAHAGCSSDAHGISRHCVTTRVFKDEFGTYLGENTVNEALEILGISLNSSYECNQDANNSEDAHNHEDSYTTPSLDPAELTSNTDSTSEAQQDSLDQISPTIEEPTSEICGDGIDNNSNGATDCDDVACALHDTCIQVPELCSDGDDNDHDGATDCGDSDCSWDLQCQPQEQTCIEETFNPYNLPQPDTSNVYVPFPIDDGSGFGGAFVDIYGNTVTIIGDPSEEFMDETRNELFELNDNTTPKVCFGINWRF